MMAFFEDEPDVASWELVAGEANGKACGRGEGGAAGGEDASGVGEILTGGSFEGEAVGEEVQGVACLALGWDQKDVPQREFTAEVERDPRISGACVDPATAPTDLLLQGFFGEDREVIEPAFQPSDALLHFDEGAVEKPGHPADRIRRLRGRNGEAIGDKGGEGEGCNAESGNSPELIFHKFRAKTADLLT